MNNSQPKKYPFSTHLNEVRSRLLVVLFFLLAGTVVGYLLHEQILSILLLPFDQPLYYSSPAGGLDFILQLSFFFGGLVSIPVFVYQVLKFIEPAVSTKFRKSLPQIVCISCLLLVCGMSFAYFVSLPAALYFLDRFNTNQVQSLISTTEYFSFMTRYIFGFGLVFQVPLMLVTINSIKKISTRALMSYQRWVILSSVVLAAILTPTPDLFNQLIMAVPLILLYEVSILILIVINKNN